MAQARLPNDTSGFCVGDHRPVKNREPPTTKQSPLVHPSTWRLSAGRHFNDPSAGSPTYTLLRLLLPLDHKVQSGYPWASPKAWPQKILGVPVFHPAAQSVGATGGVYKEQGQNRHGLVNRAY